jgi:hypothetical protein
LAALLDEKLDVFENKCRKFHRKRKEKLRGLLHGFAHSDCLTTCTETFSDSTDDAAELDEKTGKRMWTGKEKLGGLLRGLGRRVCEKGVA